MITAIIQAHMSSTRLPAKVMMKIKNKPLLYYVINQTLHSKNIDKLIVATTKLPIDDKIIAYTNSQNIEVFRGNELNVLDRYYQCAKKYDVDVIVRITSDCPLIDPDIIDTSINEFKNNNFDYLSNVTKKEDNKWIYHLNGFPAGFAVEVFTFNALEKAWKNAKKPSEKEHVTLYILNNPEFFKIGNIKNSNDYSDIRLTVDHKVDFDLIKTIIEYFPEDEIFNIKNIVTLLNKNPKLKQMNSHLQFNEGYLKSLEEDKIDENKIN